MSIKIFEEAVAGYDSDKLYSLLASAEVLMDEAFADSRPADLEERVAIIRRNINERYPVEILYLVA